jgi:uncharacterized LabA/DUF88 family protein
VRYALLVDGAFVCKRLYRMLGNRHATAHDVIAECERVRSHAALRHGTLLRIHYYDAPPAAGQLTNPVDGRAVNLGQTATFSRMASIHDTLELSPDFALRRGEVVARGWRLKEHALHQVVRSRRVIRASDVRPDLRQKGVDLRMGLDIARLSLRRLVDVIVVVTGDSDLVPAFRFARREGIRVYLDHLGAPVMRDLKAHTDLVL